MAFHSLLHYVVKNPNTRVAVSLRQLAAEVQEHSSSGEKAELLCDFSTVVRWLLSGHDREQIQNGKLSPYSTIYGGDFNSYGDCMLKFVESLEQVGIRPVFFLSGPPGSKKNFEKNYELYKENTLRIQEACSNMEQVCAGNRDVLQMKWSLTEAISIQVQCVLRTAGVCVVSCRGQALTEVVQYSRIHNQVIGIVSNDIQLAIFAQGVNLFIPDLLGISDAMPLRALTAGQCSAVSSSSLAGAMGVKENQLPDIAILSRCDESVLAELGLVEVNLEDIVKWLANHDQPLDEPKYPKYKAMMLEMNTCFLLPLYCDEEKLVPSPEPEDPANSVSSTHKKTENVNSGMVDNSLVEIVTAKVQAGSMMSHLLSIVEGCYWRSSAVELASLGQPCINDLTLALRKSLYSLMGLKSVTEYGRTGTKAFDTISVEFNNRVECGASFFKSLEERPLNERLSLLFDLIGNQQRYRDSKNLEHVVPLACRIGSEISKPISGAAVVACAALLFLFQCNEVISSFPQIKYFELDALLITCLTCVAEYPPSVLLHRPPKRAVSIGMYFSHILEQAYIIASYLGLLSEFPAPARLFYSMAYISYHVAGFSEVTKVTPSNVDGPSLAKIQDQFSSLQNLEPVLALQAEIINTSKSPNLSRLLQLFTSSVNAVTSYKERMREISTASSLRVDGVGFNLRIDKTDDVDLSSSVNSDSSIFVKCNELSSAQDYQASEEDLYFASIFGDVIGDDDDVIDNDVMTGDIDVIGNAGEDIIFPISDVDQFNVDSLKGDAESVVKETKKLVAANQHSTNPVGDGCIPLSTKESLPSDRLFPAEESHQPTTSSQSNHPPQSISEQVTVHEKTLPPINSSVTASSRHSLQHQVDVSHSSPSHSCTHLAHFQPPAPLPSEEQVLPVMIHQEKILQLVRNHRVVCIEGETGCGKSTKIPQFILDDSLNSSPAIPCRILVTQPRRVAVVKLAERVAAERKERIGQRVGYCIGGERHRTSETALTYCTVGYLLHALVHNPSMLLRYTHIILDEIHERSTDADFALIIVRKLVATSTNLKVIIMSATMESHLIASYFEEMVNFADVADPYFVGAKRYNIERYFIDELDRLADTKKSVWNEWQAIASSNLKELVLKQPPENLQEALTRKPSVALSAQQVCTEVIISQANLGEQILVFLPGISEIAAYYEMLTSVLQARNIADHFVVFVMHSQVPFEDQKDVFKPPPACQAHVILATNIAESSITLPRLRLVINFGIYRQLEYNAKRHMSQLTKKWCSHASCAQRAGRAGRVFEGVAVHLFTKRFFLVIAPEFDPPEILHAPLAKLVLQAKQIGSKMGVPSPSEFLSQAMDPPSLEQMELAVKELASFGAIVSQPGSPVLEDAEITLLGRFALTLPLDIEFSRLVLYSIFFGVPTEGIIIAAAASLSHDVFSLPTRMVIKEEATYGDSLRRSMNWRKYYDDGQFSDSVMICNMFREWIEYRNRCSTDTSLQLKHSFLRVFCNTHSVRWQRLLQLEHSVAEIACRVLPLIPSEYQLFEDIHVLSDITSYRRGYNFMADMKEDGADGGRKHRRLRLCTVTLHYCEDVNIIKALMAAAFCHNFVLGHRGSESLVVKEKSEAIQALSIMKHLKYDPAETIIFRSDQTASGVDVHNLVSTVLPRRSSEYKLVDRFWYVHLHPEFNANPKTCIMRGVDPAEATLSSESQTDSSIISHELSPDIRYFWQYGERAPTWKVADASFSRPQHPFIVNWTRISKEKEKVFVNSWRNPCGLVCDLGKECAPFLGILSFVQGVQYRNIVSCRGVTVLPSLSRGKEALLLLLAFQPQNVKISFVMNRGVITGLKIDSFNFPLPVALWRMISVDDLVRINELRQAMSQAMRIDAEVSRRLPLEDISIISSLLKCVLNSTPSDLTCTTEQPSLRTTTLEASQQLDGIEDSDDSEFEFDAGDTATVLEDAGKLPLTSFYFYPPIECPLLDGCMVRPIPMDFLEPGHLFQKKTTTNCKDGGQARSTLWTPLPSQVVQQQQEEKEQVQLHQFEELDELEKLAQQEEEEDEEEDESEQLNASFRLSPMAEPFVPKSVNFNPLLACPPSIASHSQQYQNVQGMSVQDEEALKNVQEFPLHNVQDFPNPSGDSVPLQSVKDFSVKDVQELSVGGCGFEGNQQQQQQLSYGVVSDQTPPPPPSPAGGVEMSNTGYFGTESVVHPPALPMYPPPSQVNQQSLYLQSLLQIVENVLQNPGQNYQDMQHMKAICQNLLQTQALVPPVAHHSPLYHIDHVGYPTDYIQYPVPRENEQSSSIPVQSTSALGASQNSYRTDNSIKNDGEGDGFVESASVHTKNEVVTEAAVCYSQEQTTDNVQHGEGGVSTVTVPLRPLRSPTTGLVEEHMEDERSPELEISTDGQGNAQTGNLNPTKVMEVGQQGEQDEQHEKSPTKEKSTIEAAATDDEVKEPNLKQVNSFDFTQAESKVDQLEEMVVATRSSVNQLQTVADQQPSSAVAQVEVPKSIGNVLTAPINTSSFPIVSSQTIYRQTDQPQIQTRLTKSEMSLNNSPPIVGCGPAQPISQICTDYLSRLTQALLSPPRRSHFHSSSIPLPLPLSQLAPAQQSRPSSTFVAHPRGPRPSGQIPLTGHYLSNPSIPGSSFNTAQIRPFYSSPSLANSCSRLSLNLGQQPAMSTPVSFPNNLPRGGTLPTPNAVRKLVVGGVSQQLQPTQDFVIPQAESRGQRSGSILPVPPHSPQSMVTQVVNVRDLVGVPQQRGGNSLLGIPQKFVPHSLPRPPGAHPANVPPPIHIRRPHGREMSPIKRHPDPMLRYQGPIRPSGSGAHLPPPPSLGCPLPLPPSHRRRRQVKPPPPHPALLMNYTARHKISPLVPALLPHPSSNPIHNHQASGLHVQPLKFNRQSSAKKEKKPSYEHYGITEEALLNCYCTMLATKGMDLQLNLLCGPYYRDILKCYRVCARENELLDPCFFDHYPCFTVYGEPGHYMVKLNSVTDTDRRQQQVGNKTCDALPACEATPTSDFLPSSDTPPTTDTAPVDGMSDDRKVVHQIGDAILTQPETADASPKTTDAWLTQPETETTASSITLTQPETQTDVLPETLLAQAETTDEQPETTITLTVASSETQCESTDVSLTQPETTLTQAKTTEEQPETQCETTQPEATATSLTLHETTDAQRETTEVQPETTDTSLTQPESTMTQPETTDASLKQFETADASPDTSNASLTQTTDQQLDTTLMHSTTSALETHPEITDSSPIQTETTDASLTHSETSLTQPESTDIVLIPPEAVDSSHKQTKSTDGSPTQLDTTLIQPETTLTQHDATVSLMSQPEVSTTFLSKTESLNTKTSLEVGSFESVILGETLIQCEKKTGETGDKIILEGDTEATIRQAVSQSVLEAAVHSVASTDVADGWIWDEVEGENTQDVTLVPDDTDVTVASEIEEVGIDLDPSRASVTAPSSEVPLTARGDTIKEDQVDIVQLASVTASESISGEDRPSSVTSFDETCWIENGQPATYSAPESTTSTQSGPEVPKMPMTAAGSGYDEDCWQENTPPESVNEGKTEQVPFRPIRILRREESGQEPFVVPKDQRRPPISQSHRMGGADSDGSRTSRDELSRSGGESKYRKKSKNNRNKKRNRNLQEEGRERYSPAPPGSSISSGRMDKQPSMSRERGERRPEYQRYDDEGRQQFRREGSGNRPRRMEGERGSSQPPKDFEGRLSDEGIRKRPTQEYGRKRYGPYQQRYGTGWSQRKDQSGMK